MSVVIAEIGGVLCVKSEWYAWRRVNGQWQMLGGDEETWFDCEIQDPSIRRHALDYECCLQSYAFDEGPSYPQGSKKGNAAQFFRDLQVKELRIGSKGIFRPVNTNYDPHAENRKRVALNMSRLTRNTAWLRKYLTD
jgi:hypothetical protein